MIYCVRTSDCSVTCYVYVYDAENQRKTALIESSRISGNSSKSFLSTCLFCLFERDVADAYIFLIAFHNTHRKWKYWSHIIFVVFGSCFYFKSIIFFFIESHMQIASIEIQAGKTEKKVHSIKSHLWYVVQLWCSKKAAAAATTTTYSWGRTFEKCVIMTKWKTGIWHVQTL